MSVINQMLRDLDQRNARPLEGGLGAGTLTPAAGATRPAARPFKHRVAWMALGLSVLAAAGYAVWRGHLLPTATSPDLSTSADAPLPATASADPVVQSAPETPTAVQPAAGLGLKLETALSVLPTLSREPVVQTLSVAPAAPVAINPRAPAAGPQVGVASTLPMPQTATAANPSAMTAVSQPGPAPLGGTVPLTQLAPSLPAATAPAAAAPPSTPDPAVAAQRQQTAIRDVLSQAQALYGSGSADAAIQLLHDSLAGAERALPPAPPAIQLQLVRELARMELAQGRSAAVLELLGRVEPLLAGQPELWAVRANAAQRLGRHQDAVQFYAVALQSRPAEQRWLMGSAVSLAALGQLSAAAEAAEKARSVAPVSKDVWAYLRQQGVALPERP